MYSEGTILSSSLFLNMLPGDNMAVFIFNAMYEHRCNVRTDISTLFVTMHSIQMVLENSGEINRANSLYPMLFLHYIWEKVVGKI